MATPVEMAAPEMPHKGINNKLSTNTVITISTVKRTSYLYFFDVENIDPFKPPIISVTRPIIRKKNTHFPSANSGRKKENIKSIFNQTKAKDPIPVTNPTELTVN